MRGKRESEKMREEKNEGIEEKKTFFSFDLAFFFLPFGCFLAFVHLMRGVCGCDEREKEKNKAGRGDEKKKHKKF